MSEDTKQACSLYSDLLQLSWILSSPLKKQQTSFAFYAYAE